MEPFRLTEFDREVLSILMSHGGWNASARGRLAMLAKRYGVSATGLSRVVVGLARAARQGQLQEASALLLRSRAAGGGRGAGARGVGDGARVAGAAASASTRTIAVADAQPPRGALARADRILLGIVATLLLLSIGLATQLGVMIWHGVAERHAAAVRAAGEATGGGKPGAESDRGAAESFASSDSAKVRAGNGPVRATDGTASDRGTAAPAGAAGAPGADDARTPAARTAGARRPAAVSVSYPKAPNFTASLDAPAFMQAIAEARSASSVFEGIVRDPRSVLASRQRWDGVQRAIGVSWPRLDVSLRRAHLERTLAIFRAVDDPALARALLEPLRRAIAAPPTGPAEIRAGAWSAGVIGALLSEPGLSPELVEAIAVSRLSPADGQGDAFERFASGWLDRALGPVIDQVGRAAAQEDFDRLESWIEAHQRLRRPEATNDAWLRAIDTMLRRPLRFDLPGTSADALGRFISLVDWTSGGTSAAAGRRRLEAWMLDAAIDAPRLWAMLSILRQLAAAPWFTAEMLVGERAPMADRRAALDRMLAVFEAAPTSTAPVSRAPIELLARRDALLERLSDSRPDGDSTSPNAPRPISAAIAGAARPARSAFPQAMEFERLEALGVVGAMLLEGRAVEASQRLSQLENELARPVLTGLGRGGRSLSTPADPSSDGQLGKRLDQARSAEERVDAIRRRRTETSTDLGPLDAARLAHEALLGEPSAVRSTAQGVVVDSFASGPRVAQELADQFVPGGGAEAAIGRFIERLTGERLPPHTNPQFRNRALGALLRHRLKLSEHAWHGFDALLASAASIASERLEIEGGATESLREAREPTAAIEALGGLLGARAASRAVLHAVPAPLDELDRRHDARRALAVGLPQRLVAELWRVLELEAFIAAADRPGRAVLISEIVQSAVANGTRAESAFEQALVIERARLSVQTVLLGAEPVRVGSAPQQPAAPAAAPVPGPGAAPSRRIDDAAVAQRLAALEPVRPGDYLLLAEEVEARARTEDERALARELYGLAGALDPSHYGASAALAQANLAELPADRARLVRLAHALQPGSRRFTMDDTLPAATSRFTQLLGAYRRGQGPRARELIANAEVAALVDAFGESFEGGAAGFRNAIATQRDQPIETQARMLELMFLEEALMAVSDGFVAELLRSNGEPLVACDPLRPGPELGVDPTRARWRDGRWSE